MVHLVSQDLSVAGKRAGLAGERSGLFIEQIRVIKEMRDEYRRASDNGRNVSPRYMVWENVGGVFSSNKGEDFRCVLEEIAKVSDENAVIPKPPKGKWQPCGLILGNGWSIAWRIHDAQFWGVPQRRKRICVLADFNGQSAGHILFELWRETNDLDSKQTVMDTRTESRSEVQSESEGMCGNFESCRASGKGTPEDFEGGSHTSGRAIIAMETFHCTTEEEIVQTLKARDYKDPQVVCLNDQGGQQMSVSENVTATLRAEEHGHQPIVFEPSAASQ